MRTVHVSSDNVVEFVRYCQRYGGEHDESFLPGDSFAPTDDYPAYLLCDGSDVLGAVGLMRPRPYRDKGKARLVIFHTVEQSFDAYAALLEAIRPHTSDLSYVYGFLPEAKAEARRCWEALGFAVERYVYLLIYLPREAPQVAVPEGCSLAPLEQDDQVGIRELCDLWNRNYEHQLGFVGATPDYIRAAFNEDEYVPGGILLLRHGARPVGTAQVFGDSVGERTAGIGMLSVHPDYRGRGLGRLMLRKALEVALDNGLRPVYLSVNATNNSAVALYLSEGFAEDTAMVCYTLAV